MKKTTLGILGYGNMAQAIVRALTTEPAEQARKAADTDLHIIVSDVDTQKLAQCPATVQNTTDNAYAVSHADIVLLAVKPQVAPQLLSALSLRGKTVISIMAGTSVETLQKLTQSDKIVRVMPNLNARVFRSYNAYVCVGLSSEERAFVHMLLSTFGTAEQVEESQLDAVTGLTGSSPAFVFMFIKALTEQGIALGFSPETARSMALATLIGSAETVQSDEHIDIDVLIDSVCSKGGTTIEGVRYLREQNFEQTVQTAVQKAVRRAKELSGIR